MFLLDALVELHYAVRRVYHLVVDVSLILPPSWPIFTDSLKVKRTIYLIKLTLPYTGIFVKAVATNLFLTCNFR